MSIGQVFTTVKGFVSKGIGHLDEIATVDEKKWRRRISTLQTTLLSDVSIKKLHSKKVSDIQAGTDMLYKYETMWTQMHHANEVIVAKAVLIDADISKIHKTCEIQSSRLGIFQAQLGNLPKLRTEIGKINATLVGLTAQMNELESLADELELLLDQRELRQWKAQQISELNEHMSKKGREVRAKDFLLRKEREGLEAVLNEEKSKHADDAFQQDLEEFMKDPKPRSFSTTSAKSMDEELKEALKNIEVAEKDEGGLTEFLDSLDSVIESSDAKTNSADLEDSRSIEVLKDEDYSEE